MSRLATILSSALALGILSAVSPLAASPVLANAAEASGGYSTQATTWAELLIVTVAILIAAGISALVYGRPKRR